MSRLFLLFLLLLFTHFSEAQDTIRVRDDYALAVQEAKAGKKVVLALFKTKNMKLPKTLAPALKENLIGFVCDNCDLKRFPKGLDQCTNLTVVKVNWHWLQEAPNSSPLLAQFFRAPNLKVLIVHGFKMPKATFKSQQLEQLDWTEGKLNKIPAFVFQQKQLKILKLGCSNIKFIDEEIGQLSNLENLYFSDADSISSLPSSMAQLKKLKSFSITAAQLKTFPSLLWHLPKLESLYLHYPGLSNIPDDIPKNSALRSFILSERKDFLGFPPSFSNLQLERLIVDVHQPSCEVVHSRPILFNMKANIATYEVSIRGTGFPSYVYQQHITNLIQGIWKADKAFSFSSKYHTKGQYLVMYDYSVYLTNNISAYPKTDALKHEIKHSLFSLGELQYSDDDTCVYGEVQAESGNAEARRHAGEPIQFSYNYNPEQQQLTIVTNTGQSYTLTRVH